MITDWIWIHGFRIYGKIQSILGADKIFFLQKKIYLGEVSAEAGLHDVKGHDCYAAARRLP